MTAALRVSAALAWSSATWGPRSASASRPAAYLLDDGYKCRKRSTRVAGKNSAGGPSRISSRAGTGYGGP